MEGDAQKRPRGDERCLGATLGEGFQGGERSGTLLYFVEHDKRFGVFGIDARVQAYGVEQAGWGQLAIELPSHGFVFEEVHVGYGAEVGAAELFDEPGLSYLSRALHEQRPAPWGVFPGDEIFHGESFHRDLLSMVGRLP